MPGSHPLLGVLGGRGGSGGGGLRAGKVVAALTCRELILFHFFSSAKSPQLVPIFSMLLIPSKTIPASPGVIKVN